jgi:hypothetical protein
MQAEKDRAKCLTKTELPDQICAAIPLLKSYAIKIPYTYWEAVKLPQKEH